MSFFINVIQMIFLFFSLYCLCIIVNDRFKKDSEIEELKEIIEELKQSNESLFIENMKLNYYKENQIGK